MTALGRGVRKPQAKLAGHLETLNRGMVMVARSRGRGNIIGAVTEWYGAALKQDARSLAQALDALKTFDRMVGGEERDEHLFDLLQEYLSAMERSLVIEKGMLTRRLLTQAFLFQLLARLGYRLETARSLATGEALQPDVRYGLSVAEGGVVEWEYTSIKRNITPIGTEAIKLLRLFFSQRLTSLAKVVATEATLAETQAGLDALIRWVTP